MEVPEQADQKRRAGAEHRPGEHVAAQRVGTERMRGRGVDDDLLFDDLYLAVDHLRARLVLRRHEPERRNVRVVKILVSRIVGCQERGKHRREENDRDDRDPELREEAS